MFVPFPRAVLIYCPRQSKRSVEVDHAKQEDDIPIDNIMKRIIESVTKPLEKIVAKDMVDVDKETESEKIFKA